MSLSVGGSYNISSTNYVNGFNAGKIQRITISSDDIKKYGIDIDDFNKVDKDQDGLISASEFLSSGISISSIYNAFKQEATKIDGAYVDSTNNIARNNNNEQNGFANPIQQQKPSLNHPSVANHPFLAHNLDFNA